MITLQKIADASEFTLCTTIQEPDKEISKLYCCDLLSIAMGKAPADACWVTVMANLNTLAVASLADVACVVLAEGVAFDAAALAKANDENIPVFTTSLPIFDAATIIAGL